MLKRNKEQKSLRDVIGGRSPTPSAPEIPAEELAAVENVYADVQTLTRIGTFVEPLVEKSGVMINKESNAHNLSVVPTRSFSDAAKNVVIRGIATSRSKLNISGFILGKVCDVDKKHVVERVVAKCYGLKRKNLSDGPFEMAFRLESDPFTGKTKHLIEFNYINTKGDLSQREGNAPLRWIETIGKEELRFSVESQVKGIEVDDITHLNHKIPVYTDNDDGTENLYVEVVHDESRYQVPKRDTKGFRQRAELREEPPSSITERKKEARTGKRNDSDISLELQMCGLR